MVVSDLEVEEAPGDSIPFYLEPILVDLEGGRYISPIIPASLSDLFAGSQPAGGITLKGVGGSGGGGVSKKPLPMVVATGGSTRVRVPYDAHLPSLSLWYGKNLRSILMWAVLPTLCGHVICKNWHL